MTKILLVAEGAHEHGSEDEEGALPILIRRLLNDPPDLAFDRRKPADVEFTRSSDNNRYRQRGKGHGVTKAIVRFLRAAEARGFDAMIYLIDEDRDHERRDAIDKGQEISLVTLPRACGLAIRTFDAWMLADEKAISQTLGINIQRQPDPEQRRHPKYDCQRLHEQSPCQLQPRQVYAGISQKADLEQLSRRCPDGFAPFAQRVREMGHEMRLFDNS